MALSQTRMKWMPKYCYSRLLIKGSTSYIQVWIIIQQQNITFRAATMPFKLDIGNYLSDATLSQQKAKNYVPITAAQGLFLFYIIMGAPLHFLRCRQLNFRQNQNSVVLYVISRLHVIQLMHLKIIRNTSLC